MKAVVDLMDSLHLFIKGHTVYTDSWYRSPTLFHYLQSRKTNAVGTVRLNRKFMPADLPVFKPKKDKRKFKVRKLATGMDALA